MLLNPYHFVQFFVASSSGGLFYFRSLARPICIIVGERAGFQSSNHAITLVRGLIQTINMHIIQYLNKN